MKIPDYEKMYHLLFNAITDALTQLEAQNYGDVIFDLLPVTTELNPTPKPLCL